MGKQKIKEKPGVIAGRWIIRIFLLIWTVTIVYPLAWVMYTSFKNNKEFYADVWALPEVWRVENYDFAWNAANFSGYFLNSMLVVVVSLVLTLIFTSSTAYIIAKFRYRWLRGVDKFFLIVRTIPGVLVLVPQYFMFLNMRLTDNLYVLAFLYSIGTAPISIMMQMGFMRSIDDALLEAADIDGASEFSKYWHIILPCVKPALFLTALNSIMGSWNEFIKALTFIRDESKYTVAIGLSYLKSASTYSVEYGGLFAGLVIAMIPIIVVYTIFQKPLQEGIKIDGGVKG
jgi:N-acetylglucosamine transport system permease protein